MRGSLDRKLFARLICGSVEQGVGLATKTLRVPILLVSLPGIFTAFIGHAIQLRSPGGSIIYCRTDSADVCAPRTLLVELNFGSRRCKL